MEQKSRVGTGSRFTRSGGVDRSSVKFSKIGLGYPLELSSEAAIMQRMMKTRKGAAKTIKYVAVGLQSLKQDTLAKIGKAIDEFVEEMHLDDK